MNVPEHALPRELRFPKPPFRIDGRLVDAMPDTVSSYLGAIRSWRLRVLDLLKDADGKYQEEFYYLSAKAQEVLATFLTKSQTRGTSRYAAQSPYNLCAFPQDLLEGNARSRIESVMGVLRWRADVVDYLSDAPNAMFPAIEVDESIAIDQFLSPIDHQELCWLCLTEFEQEQNHPEAHECLLLPHARARWPEMPSAFRTWAAEAKKKSP